VADQRKARFHQPEGDHLTGLTVYQAWAASKFSPAWCFENYVQARAMKRAQDVRKQLLGIMDRYKLEVVSCGRDFVTVCKALVSGFFNQVAKKDAAEGYRTVVDGQPVYIHPGSAIFQHQPEWVLYHELILTTKEYMRSVMAVDPKWLVELAPRFFKPSDPTKLTREKRRVKIEPLFNKFEEPGAWRLTKSKFYVLLSMCSFPCLLPPLTLVVNSSPSSSLDRRARLRIRRLLSRAKSISLKSSANLHASMRTWRQTHLDRARNGT